jgi:hypothetical protein
MAEDAMLTYRLVRAGEKKVFRIDVGNIDEDDIEEYVYKVATKFKKTPQVHPSDGQIDYRFNILGNDEDYFLPMRNANSQTGIDTLPGASNLGDIHDIEYLRDNLFMGLGVPKPFLSFQDAQGGGKNLAQFDMRFTKKINRIQQALIQELNKMAIIHLKLLGYDDRDLTNFTLTLTNPSTQSELMMSEVLREKAQTYTELTRADNGIAAMSHTKAKKLVFNMSESDILEDLKQQKMEMVVKQELQDSPVVIKRTGLFKDIDDMYGEPVEGQPLPSDQEGGDEGGMPPESSGIPPSGAPAGPPGGAPTGPPGGDAMGGGGGEIPGLSEGTLGGNLTMKQYEAHVNQLLYGEEKVKEKNIAVLLESKNKSLNERASTMMSEIDKLLENTTTINRKPTEDSNIDAVDFEDIENIDLEEK